MPPALTLTKNTIGPTLSRWATYMSKSMPQALREGGKRVTRMLLAITPPANAGSGSLTNSSDSFRVGKAAILTDLNRVLAPKKLKGFRTVTQVFGHKLTTPSRAITKELYPDVAGLYHSQGHGGRVRNKFYVDARKFKQLATAKFAKVGILASGWSPAAQALSVSQPAWVSRHGLGRGSYTENFSGDSISLTAGNFAPGLPANIRGELARRIPYAVQYVERGMRDNIRSVALKGAHDAGIKTAA